jgi:PBP1b-binding outer membrane lipoprotein LpoB
MKKYILILIIATVLAGCSEDYLDKKSLNDLAEDAFWNNESDALLALQGCYSMLQSKYIFNSDPWGGVVVPCVSIILVITDILNGVGCPGVAYNALNLALQVGEIPIFITTDTNLLPEQMR